MSYTFFMTAILTVWTLSNALGCELPDFTSDNYHIVVGPAYDYHNGRPMFWDNFFVGPSSNDGLVQGFCRTKYILGSIGSFTHGNLMGKGCQFQDFISQAAGDAMCDFSNRIEEVNRVFMQDLGKLADAIDGLTHRVDSITNSRK
jgi:hypothetical protein